MKSYSSQALPSEIVRSISAKLDPLALGLALGIVCAAMVFGATNILLLKGGEDVGTHLSLLSNYWPGFEVTVRGSFVGALYAAATGFFFGFLTAMLRNGLLTLYLGLIKLWANLSRTYFLDRLE